MNQADEDYILALQLQEQFIEEPELERHDHVKGPNNSTSLVDPYWEMTDPNPDIRALFLQFNERFFWGRLAGIEVRWSPRMTLCAGLCCYEGRGGLCSVRLSVPLLKLRPRKDLVETLLHEMIHAYLFVTENNKDHDGHGPEFHKHMYRINKEAGTHISVYHNFHDEVDSYRQHWWRCNGSCRERKPFYGYVKRSMNRAPSKNDTWWNEHQRTCGGTFTKIKEPENYGKKKGKEKQEGSELKESKKEVKTGVKSMDIRVFAGTGVTLGGQKQIKQGNSHTSTSSSSSNKPGTSASSSSDFAVDRKREGSPSLLASETKSQLKSKEKVLNKTNNIKDTSTDKSSITRNVCNRVPAFPELPNEDVSMGKQKVKKKTPTKQDNDKTNANNTNVKKSNFSLSDFSDSDDDLLGSIPLEKVSEKNADSTNESCSQEGGSRCNTGRPVINSEDNAGDNDVRAMLRKVWGEKNFGNSAKQKVIKKKVTGNDFLYKKNSSSTVPLNLKKGKLETAESKSKHIFNGQNLGAKVLDIKTEDNERNEVTKQKSVVIMNDRKRHNSSDDDNNLHKSKRWKKNSPTESENSLVDNMVGFDNQNSQCDSVVGKANIDIGEDWNYSKYKTDGLSENSRVSNDGGPSKLFNEIKKIQNSSSQETSKMPKSDKIIKSPIEKLFDKMKEKHKQSHNVSEPVCDISALSESDATVYVNNENREPEKEQDISICPVCSKSIPTPSINEHLDLCLTLQAI